jgi:hypothetical protein
MGAIWVSIDSTPLLHMELVQYRCLFLERWWTAFRGLRS